MFKDFWSTQTFALSTVFGQRNDPEVVYHRVVCLYWFSYSTDQHDAKAKKQTNKKTCFSKVLLVLPLGEE